MPGVLGEGMCPGVAALEAGHVCSVRLLLGQTFKTKLSLGLKKSGHVIYGASNFRAVGGVGWAVCPAARTLSPPPAVNAQLSLVYK